MIVKDVQPDFEKAVRNEIPFSYRNDIPIDGAILWELSFQFDLPDDWGRTYLGPDKTKKFWQFWEAFDWLKWVLWDKWQYDCPRCGMVLSRNISCGLCRAYGWDRTQRDR